MLEPIAWYILFAAFVLDFVMADPKGLPHPVIWMGNAIVFFEDLFRKGIKSPFFSGLIFALFLIGTTFVISWGMIRLCFSIHWVVGQMVNVFLLFYCFSSKSLEKAGMAVFDALGEKNIQKARQQVGMIVGRQTAHLDESAITRAGIETIAENFVDGFLSPLFFALIGGVPAALAYKMINTLDSMVGYQNEKYILFGRAAAKIDDAANYIPARISVLLIAMASSCFSIKRGKDALKTAYTEGRAHKSPNAGFPEAAFSGALEIKLGGPNYYHGTLVEKPYIGKRYQDPKRTDIKRACDLMMLSSFLATIISCLWLLILL
ncbi:MAG: cobalamin biosynthesis protein CobD [Desulfobacteraceae bacterium]|nr:cobalamin biosynthesis protein CobD [Desulfobacteraceae bacterium]